MNDLDICKRIAEIESVEVDEIANNFLIKKDITFGLRVNVSIEFTRCKTIEDYNKVEEERKDCLYNPLTDDALCFQLMVKYTVELSPLFSGCWSATVAKTYTFDEQLDYKLCPTWLDESPNKAICLAIIEAHNQ